jgi:hypothetical protein
MAKPLRNVRFILPLVVWEKNQLDRQAREANLNTSDYVRGKLGLAKARKTRNRKEETLENPEGDPENAVDVEELARRIYEAQINVTPGENDFPENAGPMSLAICRREAKRRLAETR